MKKLTVRQLREAFWAENPAASRALIPHSSGVGASYTLNTRLMWLDWLTELANAGHISWETADEATLIPCKRLL